MISAILLSIGVTLGIVLATRRFLPRIPDWLTISFVVIVPPACYVIYTIYQTLVEIGKYEAINGGAPPDVVTGFSESVSDALLEGAVWAILALAVAFFVLRVLNSRADK